MADRVKPRTGGGLVAELQERAKELNCLYRVEELLGLPSRPLDEVFRGTVEAIPPGWQYPDICVARIAIDGRTYTSPNFTETEWTQRGVIRAGDNAIGLVEVFYTKEMPEWDDGPFLKEEARLIGTIADRKSVV